MSNKNYKLLNTDEFTSVFNFRKRLSTNNLFIHYAPNNLGHYRIGFVVAKKIEKRAVRRNYIRRSIREIIKHNLNKTLSVDIVFRLKKPYYKSDFSLVKSDLINLLNKIVL